MMSSPALSIPSEYASTTTTLPIVAGAAAFGSTLALSTLSQKLLVGMSTGTPAPLPTLVGMATVAMASLASHSASIKTHKTITKNKKGRTLRRRRTSQNWNHNNYHQQQYSRRDLSDERHEITSASTRTITAAGVTNTNHSNNLEMASVSIGEVSIMPHTLRICAVGLLAFKLLGGRFWAISPSSYTSLGSFARYSLPANENYATTVQRAKIERFGRLVGCHTCGTRKLFQMKPPRFVGDHMPPKAVAKQMNDRWFRKWFGIQVKYRFYPQCTSCSKTQGSILSSASHKLRQQSSLPGFLTQNLAQSGGGKQAYFHGLRFRPAHLAGGIIGAITVVNTSERDIQRGNHERFRTIHIYTEAFAIDLYNIGRSIFSFIRNK